MIVSPEVLQNITSVADAVAKKEGVEIYDIEFTTGPDGRVLRVYIDKEAGIGIDECSKVARGLNEMLDADENIIPGANYHLEVSSPGVERPLKTVKHFSKVIGKKIWIKLDKSLFDFGLQNPKFKIAKQLTEVLSEVENADLKFKVEDEVLTIPISAVSKSHVVFEIAEPEKKDKKDNKKEKKDHKKNKN